MSRYKVRERVRATDPKTNQIWRGRAIQYVDEPSLLIEVDGDKILVPAAWVLVENGDETLEQVGGVRIHTLWDDKKLKGRVIRVVGFDREWAWRHIDGRNQHVQLPSSYEVKYHVVLSSGGKEPRGRQGAEIYSTRVNDFIKRFKEKTE